MPPRRRKPGAVGDSGRVRAVVSCAQALSKRLGWLTVACAAVH
jgi:hypothetical protein